MLGKAVSAGRMGCSTDQMAASVAPPRLNSWLSGQRCHQRVGKVVGIQSPDHITQRGPGITAGSVSR
ncbi:hypothetical protein D3C79_817120 [compost metagenome]